MALVALGKTQVLVRIDRIRTGETVKMVVKDGLTITRTPNTAATLTLDIRRDWFQPERNDLISVQLDGGHNQFFGVIKKVRKKKDWSSVTAYDQLYYLKNKCPNFTYEDKTADEIYKMIIADRELRVLDPPSIQETGYKIPYRIEENSTYLDIIQTALNLTYENTGEKYYIWDDFGSMALTSEAWLASHSYIEIEANYAEDYDYEEDGTGTYSAVRLEAKVNSENEEEGSTTTYVARNEQEIAAAGYDEYYDTLQEGENGDYKAQELLYQLSLPNISFSLSGVQGDITVRGGTPVLIDFFTNNRMELIRGWYSVESVTHKIQRGYHTMDLQVSLIRMLDNWYDPNPDFTFSR